MEQETQFLYGDVTQEQPKPYDAKVDADKYFIDFTKPVARPTPVIYDPTEPTKIIVSEQNILTIVGEAKSRKSFLASLFTIDFFHQHRDKDAIYIDTEQGDWHVINVAKRVCDGCGWQYEEAYESGKFKMANLRRYTYQEKMTACEAIIEKYHPYFVVIDGIRDLMESSNDDIQSRYVTEKFLKWTEIHNCAICTIIHTNKNGETPKGHTGADLLEKSETIVLCTLRPSGNTHVKWLKGRNESFDDFEFYVDENHVPKRVGFVGTKTDDSFTKTSKEKLALASLKVQSNVAKHIWVAQIQAAANVCEKTAKDYFTNFVTFGVLVPDDREEHFFSHTNAPKAKQPSNQPDTQTSFDETPPPF